MSLAEAAGVTLRRTGSDLTGRCPFHEDGTPSLVISPAKNLRHCLGACQAGGSVIGWVMRAEGVPFRHAVELLRDGMPGISSSPAPKRSTARKLALPVDRDAADHELLGQVTDYYHRVLRESTDALGYLQRRKIASGKAVSRFNEQDCAVFSRYMAARKRQYPAFIAAKRTWEGVLDVLPPKAGGMLKHHLLPAAQHAIRHVNRDTGNPDRQGER